ncbi:PilW family protein [Aestuariirhabdus sp. LZHN29]|uniref:PilW family protein n=1 Tax=Aestuariirhabdus sp. LZHN29 TaxID=3417462 RepID=UPI003CEBBD75
MRPTKFMRNKAPGFSLVELMVAMALGVFLILGVAQIFINTSSTSRGQNALAEIHESARYAISFLSDEIQRSGDKGCVLGNVGLVNKLAPAGNTFWWDFSDEDDNWVMGRSIEGFEAQGGAWDRAVDAGITNPVVGSDILVVRGTVGAGIPVADSTGVNADLTLHDTTHSLVKGDLIVASYDCRNAAFWEVSNNPAGGTTVQYATNCGATNGPCNSAVNTDMWMRPDPASDIYPEIRKLSTRAYWVRNNPNGVPSLYWKNGTNAPEELVEGVEQLQLTYGINSNNNQWETVQEYLTADAITDWGQVTSVRVAMVVVSPTLNAASGRQDLIIEGSTIPTAYTDGFLRRTFAFTINRRGR